MLTFSDLCATLVLLIATILSAVSAQTSTTCNPTQGQCPANPALSGSRNIVFTNGASSEFTATGAPRYDSNGAAFTVAKSGDSPTLTSKWYIMFGHVDFVVKAAPGQGIVSSTILQSDSLDEIDWEWLGGDNVQAQSNYFGKGQTTTGYNRGAFHGVPGNHDNFNTYSIDWTASQIVWSINGQTVRVLKAQDAEAGQYPQTPMFVRVGAWAGGDPANAPGTVVWAGGPVDYTKGPYTMYVKAIAVTDYSTGTSYSYSGTAGTWQSIKSNGGQINSSSGGKNTPVILTQPTVTTATALAAVPFSTDSHASSIYATRTGYPWVPTTASAVTSADLPFSSSSSALPVGSSAAFETMTAFDCQGFPTVITVPNGAGTMPRSYDATGCPILPTVNPTGPISPAIATGQGISVSARGNSAMTNAASSSTGQATTTSLVTSTRYPASGALSTVSAVSTATSLPALVSSANRFTNWRFYTLFDIAVVVLMATL